MGLGIRSGFFSRLLRGGGRLLMPLNLSGRGNVSASWRRLLENEDYAAAWEENVGVSSVIDIKASAKANVRFKFKDLKTGDFIPVDQMTREQLSVYNLLKKPNPFQSTFEFWKQFEVFKSVFGNAYVYCSMPEGFTDPIETYSLTNLWAQYTIPVYTGKMFDASTPEDLIEHYLFIYGRMKKEFPPSQIIHRNDVSIELNPNGLTLGTSRMRSLQKPISGIDVAFESRNVIGKKRGALGIFSGGLKDSTGSFPLTEKNKEEVQSDFNQYGTLKDQWQYMFTRFPLTFQRTALSIKDLALFEEVATDIMHIATKYGVPEVLVKSYLQGATFENQEASERRLYQNTIIPETEDDVIGFNNYFNTAKYGFEIFPSFEHVAVLQANKVESARANVQQGIVYEKLFLKGGCTYNQWLKAIGEKPDEDIGDLKIWDLTEDQLVIIGVTPPKTNNDGNA